MKAKNHKVSLDVFAKFLIILSFFIFGLGFSYEYKYHVENDKKIDIKKTRDEGPSVSITPNDGSNVVVNDEGNSSIVPIDDSNAVSSNTNYENNSNNEDNSKNNTKPSGNNNQVANKSNEDVSIQNYPEKDLNTINAQLRNEIEATFNISIKYGSETVGYTVANISTKAIENPSTINNSLIRLRNILSLYPEGLFDEIRSNGIPLTIYLVDSYSEDNISGVTDSSFTYATISIAVKHPIEESFYHESYHYIEKYMFKRGVSFNTWNSLNPSDFSYGTVYSGNSYSNTFSEDAPFVNNYAQTDDGEDRASTFEYMMASSKARCLNNGKPVWKKAILMARNIDAALDTVSPEVTEYWERFLN